MAKISAPEPGHTPSIPSAQSAQSLQINGRHGTLPRPHEADLLDQPPSSQPDNPPPRATAARLRSIPYRWPFIKAQIFILANYASAVAVLTCIPILILDPIPRNVEILVACLASYAVTSLVSFLGRRKVLCPLCKGTPLVQSKARIHDKASRIFPFDHGTSTLFRLIFTQTFQCMYCACRFDLLKPLPAPRKSGEVDASTENLP